MSDGDGDEGSGALDGGGAAHPLTLRPHPSQGPGPVRVAARIARMGARLDVVFAASGAIDRIVRPDPAPSVRTDGLWRATCLEMFAHDGGSAYAEANWSPSGAWATYRFADYRAGMADGPDAPAPAWDDARATLAATIDLGAVLDPARAWWVGLCAVIVTDDRRTRHFALAHPPGAPDFHHRDCFAHRLAAAHGPC